MRKLLAVFLPLFFINYGALFAQQNIKNLSWKNTDESIIEAHIDECVTLYAETENIENNEKVSVFIWVKGEESDDLVGEYVSRINDNKIVFYWFVEEINTQSIVDELAKNGFAIPQIYFTIQYDIRKSHPSDLLSIYDWLNKQLVLDGMDGKETILSNFNYVLYLPDGTEREGWTDAGGFLRELNIPIGEIMISAIDEDDDHEVVPAEDIGNYVQYYQVKKGDNLRKIAKYSYVYGKSDLWRTIYEANKHNFIDENDPLLLEVGQALIIPSVNGEERTKIFWKIRELVTR